MWMGAVVCAILLVCLYLTAAKPKGDTLPQWSYSQMMDAVRAGRVEKARRLSRRKVQLTLKDGSQILSYEPGDELFLRQLTEMDVIVEEQGAAPWLLLLLLAPAVMLLRKRQQVKGVVRGEQVTVREAGSRITFSDVAANNEALHCMAQLKDFLTDAQKYTRYGARMPRGVLLYGPPGTGKTLLAKALAGESNVPFFSVNGSDFVQMYVGVGAARVRELFRKAKKAGGVIFIDEIDAVGKKRDGASDEREQTLNALLTEMSGFDSRDGIEVLAATNRPDTLDEALLRPGRFDRQIEVGLPTAEERLRILQVHARKKPLANDVCLETLSRDTASFSGAQLEALLNEAAIRAAVRGEGDITRQDVEEALVCTVAGAPKRTKDVLCSRERKVTAYHEAGHALVMHMLLPGRRIRRVSIVPTEKGAAGYTLSHGDEGIMESRSTLNATLAVTLAGRAAEEIVFGSDHVTTGAAGDIHKARELIRRMVHKWDMGMGADAQSDEKVLYREAVERAKALLDENRGSLHRLAQALLEQDTLDEQQFLAALEGAAATISP